MNHSYYESRSKEKLNDLMKEGMMSQAHYRSRSSKAGLLRRLPRFILIVLVIWGLIQMFL
jgi:hypothetical protein